MEQRCKTSNSATDVAHDSHTSYRRLSEEEKIERLCNLQKHKRKLTYGIRDLQHRAKSLITKEGVTLTEGESSDMNRLLSDVSEKINDEFPKDSFQYILWEEQRKFNHLKNKRQMKWHPVIIRFALALKYASSSAYRMVSSSGFIKLPSERTLRDYTHWCSVADGVHIPFIEHAKTVMKDKGMSEDESKFTLLMDEMKIKQGLVFSKCTGEMVGFTNLGTVNEDLASITAEATDIEHCTEMGNHLLAKSMLVFMIRPIFKPSLSFPIASYPVSNLSGEKLYPVVMEVVEALELSNVAVVAVTSDGASPNRMFYKLCRLPTGLKVPYKTRNPYADREIFFFCDPPHLMKTARNCFSNSHSHANTRALQVRRICMLMCTYQYYTQKIIW